MSHITPEGVLCVNRPWGTVECQCAMNEFGTTTCKLKRDISSAKYTDLIQHPKTARTPQMITLATQNPAPTQAQNQSWLSKLMDSLVAIVFLRA